MSRDDDRDNDRTESVGGFGGDSDRPRIKRLGHFRIDATLGSGGMGTIYRAYDESMKRPVALKVLHSSLEISQRAQSRFVREAWIAGQLDHPNIVKVYSRGEENNVSYLAMELAEGGSLYDFIKRTRESIPSGSDVTGTIDREYINDILQKFVELAGALEHIHSKGFIHRDIKPHNILLSGAEKQFKFTDFGIAHADDMTRMTRAGDFIGTVKYMSPELLAAHRAGIDKRTDIYSLGVTLYEALTLTLPFKADSEEKLIGEILAGRYIEARQTNRRIPVDLETVLMKASHHDPNRRYQTASEFADDLQRIIDGRPILAKRQSAFSKGVKYVRRNYKSVSEIAAAVIVVVGGFLSLLYVQVGDLLRPEGMTVRMVWSGDRIFSDGLESLSPDGRFVSFFNRWLGDLAILELANKEIRLLTNNWVIWGAVDTMPEERRPAFVDSLLKFGGVDGGSVWSPDGSQLAYAWIPWSGEEHGDLCLIGRDGTDKRTLTTGASEKVKYIKPCDWSKDGEYILAKGTTENDDIRLMSISAVDGSAKGIDTIEVSPHEFGSGYFSPDGRYVAYSSPDDDIFLLSVDGRSNEPIVEHPARDYLLGWSPDGRWVCFASDRSGVTDVWVIGVSDGKSQGEPRKVSRNVGEIIPLGITGEGSLYYGLESGIVDVYVATIDPEAGRLLTSPEKVTQRFEGTNDCPDWSPDGKYLLYRSDREASDNLGAKSPLCVRSMETGEERELYVQLRLFNPHHYSPDGRFVIVQGVDNDGQNGLFQIDVETGLAIILVKCEADTRIRWATWSPEGDKLFYKYGVTSEEPTRLVQYDLEARQEKELFRENSWPTCPALSPDGQWLAFQTLDGEKMIRSLNIMPADSGRLREIVRLEEKEFIFSVDWMPDGRSILYVKNTADQPKRRELWQISAEGGSPRNLGLAMDNMTYLSVHPDGRQIAFSAYKEQTEIWVMENFLPED